MPCEDGLTAASMSLTEEKSAVTAPQDKVKSTVTDEAAMLWTDDTTAAATRVAGVDDVEPRTTVTTLTSIVVISKMGVARNATAAYTSPPSAASLKQHQRLLARRHLNQSRRQHPRMSPLEAKVVVRSFANQLSGLTAEARMLADEAAFWVESVASLRHQ